MTKISIDVELTKSMTRDGKLQSTFSNWIIICLFIYVFIYLISISERYPHPPMITDGPRNQTVVLGDTVQFVCRIFSDSHPYIYWLKHYEVNGSFVNESGYPYFDFIKVSILYVYSLHILWWSDRLRITTSAGSRIM